MSPPPQEPPEPPPWGTPEGSEPEGSDPWGTPAEPGSPGTPDGTSPYGTPAGSAPYGTPAGSTPYGTPAGSTPYGTPGGSNPYGTPTGGGFDPLGAETVVVVERRGFITAGGYDLTTTDDEPIGSLVRETSAAGLIFGGAASSTSRLLDVNGTLIGSMLRPGSLGRSRFIVTDASDVQVGTVEQENAFLAPQFLLTTAEGLMLRLVGGKFSSRERQLVDGLDESVLMGQVSQEYNGLSGMLGDTQRFAVQLSPQLVGDHRLLALMATICVDYVLDAKRRRRR
jgi:hypothetical protein